MNKIFKFLEKEYMRIIQHIILGFTIPYCLGYFTGYERFTLDSKIVAGFTFTGITYGVSRLIEAIQNQIAQKNVESKFDIKTTTYSGIAGSIVLNLFYNNTLAWLLFIFSFIFILIELIKYLKIIKNR